MASLESRRAQQGAGARERRLPRNIWFLTLTSFLTDVSSEMLLNLLPIFLYSVLGVRTAFIGLIEGVAEAVSSLLKLGSGWLSDRIAVRKPLIVAGYALSALAKPFLYLATTWPGVLAVRFGDRLGKGLRTAPRDALVADSVSPGQRGRAFGLHRAGDTAGAVLGLLAALVILQLSQTSGDLERASFQRVVLLSIIPSVLAVIVLVLGVREPAGRVGVKAGPGPATAAPGPVVWDKRDLRGWRRFLVFLVMFTLGNSSDAFIILRARTLGLTVPAILGMMMIFNLVYALLAVPAGVFSDRIGRRRILVAGWGLYAVSYLGFARAAEGWHIWLWMGMYGIYYGLTEGVARALIADLVPAELRGAAYGTMHMVVGITLLPASLIAGVLWQGVGAWGGLGPGAPFHFGALLAIISAGGLAFLVPDPAYDPG